MERINELTSQEELERIIDEAELGAEDNRDDMESFVDVFEEYTRTGKLPERAKLRDAITAMKIIKNIKGGG